MFKKWFAKIPKLFSLGTTYRPSRGPDLGHSTGMNIDGTPMAGNVDIRGRNFGTGDGPWRR